MTRIKNENAPIPPPRKSLNSSRENTPKKKKNQTSHVKEFTIENFVNQVSHYDKIHIGFQTDALHSVSDWPRLPQLRFDWLRASSSQRQFENRAQIHGQSSPVSLKKGRQKCNNSNDYQMFSVGLIFWDDSQAFAGCRRTALSAISKARLGRPRDNISQ